MSCRAGCCCWLSCKHRLSQHSNTSMSWRTHTNKHTHTQAPTPANRARETLLRLLKRTKHEVSNYLKCHIHLSSDMVDGQMAKCFGLISILIRAARALARTFTNLPDMYDSKSFFSVFFFFFSFFFAIGECCKNFLISDF